MRRLGMLVVALALVASACSTIKDNVTIDVGGIIAATCQSLADQLGARIQAQLDEFAADSDVGVPDIDMDATIDRAGELGCSSENMRAMIDEKLEAVSTSTDAAKAALEDLKAQTQAP